MKTILVFFLILFAFTSLFAQNKYSVVIENGTSVELEEIYMAKSGFQFGANLLDYGILPGISFEVSYEAGANDCEFDFLAIGSDGNSYAFNGYDICNNTSFIFYDLYNSQSDHGENPDDGGGDNYMIDGDIRDVITYNTWKITSDGYEYGTLKLNADGTALKTAPGGGMETHGNWSLDDSGYYLTLHFPDEGQASKAEMNYRGNEMDLMFEGESGTYQWLLISM